MGFSVHPGQISDMELCCLFNKIISQKNIPKFLSSDNDPLFQFYRWQANLRILGIEEIKIVPYTPISHPFVERFIGTIRQELLGQTLFWNATDLQKKLEEFQHYFNLNRAHHGIDGKTPSYCANEQQTFSIPIKVFSGNGIVAAYSNYPLRLRIRIRDRQVSGPLKITEEKQDGNEPEIRKQILFRQNSAKKNNLFGQF